MQPAFHVVMPGYCSVGCLVGLSCSILVLVVKGADWSLLVTTTAVMQGKEGLILPVRSELTTATSAFTGD